MQGLLSFKALLQDRELEIELRNPAETQAVDALHTVMETTRKLALEKSPLKHAEITALGGKNRTLSPSQLATAVAAVPLARLEEQLSKLVTMPLPQEPGLTNPNVRKPKGSPVEIATSAYLAELFDKAFPPESLKWGKPTGKPREVRLAANLDAWIAVKKVNLQAAEGKEITAACAGIFNSARSKLQEFTPQEYRAATEQFLAKYPERKSFGRLAEILAAAASELPKITACAKGDAALEARLAKLFYYDCFERAGFTPFVSTNQVSRIWPELKIPKPRGNYGGKKKK
ncbi:MAG: hypothetical protein AABW54_03710 [Candidatus Micrarchaeota archaeon]